MNIPSPQYNDQPWPLVRNAIDTLLRQHRPHTVYGAIEVDVTETMQRISELTRALRMAVSFHAFVLHCLSQAAKEVPGVVSYRRGRRLITFQDIDVGTVLEKRLPDGIRVPVGYVVRGAERKRLAELNWELRTAARSGLGDLREVKFRRRMAKAPTIVRRWLSRRIRRDPFVLRKVHGTIGLTSVHSRGFNVPFWAFPTNIYTVTVAIGNISERLSPCGRETRKYLCLTAGADHAVIDGMDMARFAQQITRRLESAEGLDASFEQESRRLLAGRQ